MFENNKPRYLTRGIDAEIPVEIQLFLWTAIDKMPEPKDYLQVFNLSAVNGLQVIDHTSEQPGSLSVPAHIRRSQPSVLR